MGGLLVALTVAAYEAIGVYALSSAPCTLGTDNPQVSPDGRKKAALTDRSCGATTPLYTRVLLTDVQSKFDTERDAVAEFHGRVSRVEWSGGELRVFYGKSDRVKRLERRGETSISYWRAD